MTKKSKLNVERFFKNGYKEEAKEFSHQKK